jgi:hypothetical protein
LPASPILQVDAGDGDRAVGEVVADVAHGVEPRVDFGAGDGAPRFGLAPFGVGGVAAVAADDGRVHGLAPFGLFNAGLFGQVWQACQIRVGERVEAVRARAGGRRGGSALIGLLARPWTGQARMTW